MDEGQDEERLEEMIESIASDLDQILAQAPQAEEAQRVSK
jgi:hypothetical protein